MFFRAYTRRVNVIIARENTVGTCVIVDTSPNVLREYRKTRFATVVTFHGNTCITTKRHPDTVAVHYESTYGFSPVIDCKPPYTFPSRPGSISPGRDSSSEHDRQTPPSVIGVRAAAYLCVYASRVLRRGEKENWIVYERNG